MENFTLDQLYRYYEAVQIEKGKEERLRALTVGNAVAYGFGNLKVGEFNEFLDALYRGNKKSVEDSLTEMKTMGLPVEEGNE